MDPDLSDMAFGVEETRLGVMANDVEVLARCWIWRCLGVDVDKALAP